MAIICLALCIVFGMAGVATEGGLRIALGVLFGAAFLLFAVLTGIFANMYCAFSYHGKKQVSKRVIEGIAQYIALSDGGKGLDVGCGSGALTIACAKSNPRAQMVGIDRWGKEYASFNQNTPRSIFRSANAMQRRKGCETYHFCAGTP